MTISDAMELVCAIATVLLFILFVATPVCDSPAGVIGGVLLVGGLFALFGCAVCFALVASL